MQITLSKLNVRNLATLAKRTVTISLRPEFSVVQGNPLFEQVRQESGRYDALYTKNAFSGMGPEVEAADHNQDAIFSGIKTILTGYAKDKGSPQYADSVALYAIFEKYGTGLDRYSYSEEAAQLQKLLEELERPENAPKLANLHLTDNVVRLRVAATEFSRLFEQQVSANAALRNMESASSGRQALERALHNYFSVVSAMKNVDGWAILYAELNEAVKATRNSEVQTTTASPNPSTKGE
jgi:hypothetical protein